MGDECGKSAEWIYARLPDPQDGQGDPGQDGNQDGDQESDQDGSGQGDPQSDQDGTGQGDPESDQGSDQGEVRDAPTDQDEDGNPAPTEEDWKQKTAQAAQQAQMQGKMGAGMARAIADALAPRIDVRSLLLRFFQDRTASDYSWSQPNRRYLAQGLYLPALLSHELGEVAILVDTSGSVDEVSLQYARSIVESVISECNPAGVTVYYADADVCRVDRFARGESLVWQPAGGGGTDFRPALQAIEDDGSAVCTVAITDLYGTFPDVPPSAPVIWLATSTLTAPFGETVPIDR